jgi:TonB family protein
MSSNGYHRNGNDNQEASFTLLASGKPRWRSMGAGFGIEFVVLMCAIWIPTLFPTQMKQAAHYVEMRVIDVPYTPPPKPQPRVQPKLVPVKRVEEAKLQPEPKPVIPDPPKPKIFEPVFEKLNRVVPRERRNPTPAPKVNEWARMVPDVKTNSLGSSAMPTIRNPRTEVQTGGFGDPQGLPTTNRKMVAPVNINAAGDFNLPEGPGKGNGRGGAKGREGVVASAGFGNQTAIAGGERNGGRVQEAGFGNEETASNEAHVKKAAAAPQEQPVVILYKPVPQYTAEGRQLRIQGAVVLQVIFKASGEVQVLRVVQGLGHGLDENAEIAARQIKFTPAKEDGRPVDFPANVRINFELAY